jgi:hypothetical protein
MSGRIPHEVFEPNELERRPPRYVAGKAQQPIASSGGEIVYDSGDEETIVSRLRALGYVE